ncbi:type IV conjugative transfer system protein TraL [Vibrio sp. SCSIO 43140]|uniref:type IV conjugative transfer system protein TraL n=1 Tax=Vibrio sp. SCSIO 43140 TaxID=2819100 RepID=UPI0020753DD6|nr:type IV conjugative transfer system protein TraL [Vibrio sp. SCSIO 43140]USD59043.1 type IV conjugative transfer system protein TraL [Vibrio sp. SCSIO 43140]
MSKLDINEDNRPVLPKNQTYLPLRINDIQSIVGMEADTAGVLFMCAGLGYFFKAFLLGIAIGIGFGMLNSYVKDHYPRGVLRHMLWWNGLYNPARTRSFPDTYQRKFYR